MIHIFLHANKCMKDKQRYILFVIEKPFRLCISPKHKE